MIGASACKISTALFLLLNFPRNSLCEKQTLKYSKDFVIFRKNASAQTYTYRGSKIASKIRSYRAEASHNPPSQLLPLDRAFPCFLRAAPPASLFSRGNLRTHSAFYNILHTLSLTLPARPLAPWTIYRLDSGTAILLRRIIAGCIVHVAQVV